MANLALKPVAAATKGLGKAPRALNAAMDGVFDGMQRSREPAVACTGRVFAAVKEGFGAGYIASSTVIAVGQILMGSPLTIVQSAWSIATLSNPYVMTTAALVAVLYGYHALTDDEREALRQRVSKALSISQSLVQAILEFTLDTAAALLSSSQLDAIRRYAASAVRHLGRTLGGATRRLKPITTVGADVIHAGLSKLAHTVSTRGRSIREAAENLAERGVDSLQRTSRRPGCSQRAATPVAA